MNNMMLERSWVEIDLAAFVANLRFLKGYLHPQQEFLQIVKADAYGHGALEIAEAAISEGAVYLGVANIEEGKLLRLQGIKCPILILSPSLSHEIPGILNHDLVPGISDFDFAFELSQAARMAGIIQKIHLKLDSGMHRSGIRFEAAIEQYHKILALPNLYIEGVFSHFASSENDPEFSQEQENAFNAFVAELPQKPRYIHLNNSAAVLNRYGTSTNLVRLGISSYGVDTTNFFCQNLKPVMTFKATLSQIKTIKKGESIGYNRDWVATEDGIYGIIPIGYADGYDFLLANNGFALVRNTLCPVIGRISMDMITIDLKNDKDFQIGDEVVLLGQGHHDLRAEMLAKLYNGSAYELLCQVGRRAKRYYFQDDKLIHSTPLARRDFVSSDFGDSKLNQIISSALSQRLQSEEIGELIYREILRSFFFNKDRDIHYRKNFAHEITFTTSDNPEYYQANTTLRYRKVLSGNSFLVACASSDEALKGYFLRSDVEYRWLLDEKLSLDSNSFSVNSVRVNGFELNTSIIMKDGCLEILCHSEVLNALINTEVLVQIDTTTRYPVISHQFSVFIGELTQGVDIRFSYPEKLLNVEPVAIFSGQNKSPTILRTEDSIRIKTADEDWVFPLSGVVFTY